MRWKQVIAISIAAVITSLMASNVMAGVKLYAIDCGSAFLPDFGVFSDTGYFDGKEVEVAAPCFLISHPKGTLMWDTGNGKDHDFGFLKLTTNPVGPELKKIGLKPSDIDFLAFSHLHIDHIGQANLFTDSVWIMNSFEWKTLKDDLGEKAFLTDYPKVEKKEISGDFDVFEDGTVRILSTPGHTAGHQALLLKLDNSGTVLLSGDTFHQRESRSEKLVPAFNTNRADTLASIDRLEGIIKNQDAKLIIQHDKRDFELLPKFPKYLD